MAGTMGTVIFRFWPISAPRRSDSQRLRRIQRTQRHQHPQYRRHRYLLPRILPLPRPARLLRHLRIRHKFRHGTMVTDGLRFIQRQHLHSDRLFGLRKMVHGMDRRHTRTKARSHTVFSGIQSEKMRYRCGLPTC